MAHPSLHLTRDADEASHTSEQENDAPQATEGDIYRRGRVAFNELQKECLIHQHAMPAHGACTKR